MNIAARWRGVARNHPLGHHLAAIAGIKSGEHSLAMESEIEVGDFRLSPGDVNDAAFDLFIAYRWAQVRGSTWRITTTDGAGATRCLSVVSRLQAVGVINPASISDARDR